MRKYLPVVLALAVGFGAGWVSRPKPPAPLPPLDLAGEIGIIKGRPPSTNLRPHSVIVDGRAQACGACAPDPGAEIWTVFLDGNRVKIACTQVP